MTQTQPISQYDDQTVIDRAADLLSASYMPAEVLPQLREMFPRETDMALQYAIGYAAGHAYGRAYAGERACH